jgi:DNA/RNA-binding domain of Phe-tRNA-synthetase-like protein
MNTVTIIRNSIAACCLLLPLTCFSQQQASKQQFPNSNPLEDNPAVRDAWRKAYKDFKPPAAVAARIEELKTREREAFDLWLDRVLAVSRRA